MSGRDVHEMLGIDLDAVDGPGMDSLLLEVEVLFRQLGALRQDVVARLDASGAALERGYPSTSAYLRDALRISPHDAAGLVHAARATGPRRALTGERLEPIFSAVAAAQHAGQISPEHARIVARTVESLPAEVQVDWDRDVEGFLVDCAQQYDPGKLRQLAKHVTDVLNPDGRLDDPEYRQRQRGIDVRMNADGSSHVEGDLTAECTELLLTVRDALGKPVTTDDVPDVRTARQRCHDGPRLPDSGQPRQGLGHRRSRHDRRRAEQDETGRGIQHGPPQLRRQTTARAIVTLDTPQWKATAQQVRAAFPATEGEGR